MTDDLQQDNTLPDFADAWMKQWHRAGPELQKIRDRELRELSSRDAIQAASALEQESHLSPRSSGLVIQQLWFMRLRLLELLKEHAGNG